MKKELFDKAVTAIGRIRSIEFEIKKIDENVKSYKDEDRLCIIADRLDCILSKDGRQKAISEINRLVLEERAALMDQLKNAEQEFAEL